MDSQARILHKKQKNYSQAKTLTIRSPAKLNLTLYIVGKYKNGFHKLISLVNRISLCDSITIRRRATPEMVFRCNKKDLQNRNNLCVKAALLLQKELNLECGFTISLKKNIPVGAGLGGASSNAAHTIIGILKLLHRSLGQKQLYALGKRLGSDVNFFLCNKPWALISGRGEKVTPLPIRAKCRYFVIYPGIALSTQAVYGNLKGKLTRYSNNVNIISNALEKKDYQLVEKISFNSLEKSAFSLCKPLKNLQLFFRKRGFFCFLTGSGSSLYLFAKNNIHYHTLRKLCRHALVKQLDIQGLSVFQAQTY